MHETLAAPKNRSNVTLPARAAFYYPWFPQTWTVNTQPVIYQPTLGYYDSSDTAIIDEHIRMLEYGNIAVAIASWWGPQQQREQERLPLLLRRSAALDSALRWALYYEKEGSGNPNLVELSADLDYIRRHYVGTSHYAHVEGRPIIFVYNADDSDCEVARRWTEATRGEWYVVLKVFPGYRHCPMQPQSWHQYAPAQAVDWQRGYAYTISPGFWRADEPAARLERDLTRWRENVRAMIAAGEDWQLISTFNEWGESSAIEAAQTWGWAYLDVLANDGQDYYPPRGVGSRPLLHADASSLGADVQVTFAAAGDFGGRDDRAGAVMRDLRERQVTAFLLLGDISYSEKTPERAWCDWVHSYLGVTFPMQLMVGNHEDDTQLDGFIRNFTACMPDRLASSLGPGGYGVNYSFDLGPVTVIATAADLSVDGVHYSYRDGSEEQVWLRDTIRAARAEGDWIVVGTHKNCITIGSKRCEIGQAFAQFLIDEGVDLVLQGHDHTYQRSHALARIQRNTIAAGAIADDGSDHLYARHAGTVFVIAGTLGRSLSSCSAEDPEYAYFARYYCAEATRLLPGYLLIDASRTSLLVRFISLDAQFGDDFTIR